MLAGMAALRTSDHGTAERAFSQVVAREPDHVKAWYYRGVSRLEAGDAEGAVEDLGRVLRLAPTDANALIRHAPERMLWASNWPHPSVPADARPDDADLLDLLLEWAPDEGTRRRILSDNPAELFGFAQAQA